MPKDRSRATPNQPLEGLLAFGLGSQWVRNGCGQNISGAKFSIASRLSLQLLLQPKSIRPCGWHNLSDLWCCGDEYACACLVDAVVGVPGRCWTLLAVQCTFAVLPSYQDTGALVVQPPPGPSAWLISAERPPRSSTRLARVQLAVLFLSPSSTTEALVGPYPRICVHRASLA